MSVYGAALENLVEFNRTATAVDLEALDRSDLEGTRLTKPFPSCGAD
jgi:hypothetical protein